MESKKRQPLGIELVRRGLINENDIQEALEYQKSHPNRKIGDILYELNLCDSYKLINAIGEILGERAILLKSDDIKINISDYISEDIVRQSKAIPFEIHQGKVSVCFADTANKRAVETVRLLLLNKGLIMEKYITFGSLIEKIIEEMQGKATENINLDSDNITSLIDSIIKNGMEKRASDIHFEPMEENVRVRYRIDGELFTVATLEKEKQSQIIGRLKAISNMHQEKQEPQDGRIIIYPDYNIRVSSQKNIYGEKFVLRLLKKNVTIKRLSVLGFPIDDEGVRKSFDKKNSITVMAAPTGEGKTTSLYSIIDYLNRPEINITTIEDPVEIRIKGLNQIEVDPKTNFITSLRTVLRQDPDIILVGEIRDKETAEIAMQAGQTGHYVLSTIHTIDAIEVITRLRKMGISNYDISSTLATTVSQRLVRKLCPYCKKERKFTDTEIQVMKNIGEKYNIDFDFKNGVTYDAIGCDKCNKIGYYDRIGVFEILVLNDKIKELITQDASTLKLKEAALQDGIYRPMVIDAIEKVIAGITTLEEINKKLVIY